MAANYFVQVWARFGVKAKEEIPFPNFEGLREYVVEFKKNDTSDTLMVHLPSQATPDEKRQMTDLGATLI